MLDSLLLILIPTYILISYIFLKYPTLIHKKKEIAFSAKHVSHRGGGGESYENTLRGFQQSIENGAEMLEMDVWLSADDQVVVFHDHDLERLIGMRGKITDTKFDHLPPLKKSQVGEWSKEDRRIPLLSDVFSRFPQTPMNIEIKQESRLLIAKVDQLICEFRRPHLTVWGSGKYGIGEDCYSQNRGIHLFFSAKRVLITSLLFLCGLLPFFPIKESHYEVFLPSSVPTSPIQAQRALGISFTEAFLVVLLSRVVASQPLLNHLKRRGIHVYIWVCNEDAEFLECQKMGVTGIMTDYPTRLNNFYKPLKN